ncbi:DnaJ domain containing protein, putative [Angomonas deanei]|uniref:DnaJ domain containing protein, putative n=1 Tax=Angomonas deanei TaxID=59799 RepID=A0A7G2CLR9_9TRYP|nr:DnaJ domain containing protein, putative [Angomonas deanei]
MFRRTWWLAVMTPRAALKLLDLSPNTDLNQKSIKKAYLKRVLECHPDLNPNDTNANANFRDLSEALNIALHALDASQSPGRPSSAAGEGSYDPQASINALRKAIVAYHSYRDQQDTTRTGGEETQTDAFFTPSLEYISSVCRQENLARSRVHTFCESLPAVISGGSSGSLIEAVAFFHTRYVESMSVCVMRFSQNLPTIVRRVVKNRRRHISYRKTRLTSGIGTGTRPQEQRIEDMTMKPLVLMGALLFDLPEDDALLRGASGSTCGVSSPKEIKVADELKCTIYPSDSIGIIVDKLSRWEADSFERLKIELAIVDSTTLLTNLLGFDNDSQGVPKRAINMAPHIQSGKAQVKTVLLTLQSLSANMCYYFEECDAVDVEPDLFFENLAAADDKESSADTDASVKLSVPKLIRHCRKFFRLASSFY